MPDQGTLLRSFLAIGALFGAPLLVIASVRLRHFQRDRLFLLATGLAAALFVGGSLWLLLLFAPPAVPCAPPATEIQAGDPPCAPGSLGLQRGWPVVDVALGGLVGMGLVAVVLSCRRRRTATAEIEYLVRDVLDRTR